MAGRYFSPYSVLIRSRTPCIASSRDAEAVGSHVGDQADRPGAVDVDAFVELLGDLHGPLAGEPQPDRRLLLERAGLERGVGLVELLGLVDLGDDIAGRGQHVADLAGVGLGRGLELGAVVFGQSGLEAGRTRPSTLAGLTVAVIFQYSSVTKARISRSRSAISRTATDWTRPALRLRATLLQSSGLSW